MRASVSISLFSALLLGACSSVSSTHTDPEKQGVMGKGDNPASGQAELPTCCKDTDELAALDGQRVVLRGKYRKVNVSRRPPPLDLTTPGNASVYTGSTGIMLGVYYEASSKRSVSEIQSFHEKEVVVIGTIHARTPDQLHDGIPMQTMIGPYIEIESVDTIK